MANIIQTFPSGKGGSGGGSADFPSGGTTGQVLRKKSNEDNDVEWKSISEVPSGGTTGQALVKNGNTDGDTKWSDVLTETMPAEDMNEIFSTIPSAASRYHKYSTEEQVVAEWIDGRPVYSKVIQTTMPVASNNPGTFATTTVDLSTLNIDKCIYIYGNTYSGVGGNSVPLNSVYNYSTYVNNVYPIFARVYVDGTMHLTIKSNYETVNGRDAYVTIYYIKTTD